MAGEVEEKWSKLYRTNDEEVHEKLRNRCAAPPTKAEAAAADER